jgi:hypothetical protein
MQNVKETEKVNTVALIDQENQRLGQRLSPDHPALRAGPLFDHDGGKGSGRMIEEKFPILDPSRKLSSQAI